MVAYSDKLDMWIKCGSSLFQYFIKMLCISAPKKVILRTEVSGNWHMRICYSSWSLNKIQQSYHT